MNAYDFDIDHAAKLGNMNILLFLYINDSFYTDDAIYFAASKANVKMVDWLYENVMKYTVLYSVLIIGAQHGHINIINWGLKKDVKIDVEIINTLAICAYSCGHINVAQYLDKIYGTIDWDRLYIGRSHSNVFCFNSYVDNNDDNLSFDIDNWDLEPEDYMKEINGFLKSNISFPKKKIENT